MVCGLYGAASTHVLLTVFIFVYFLNSIICCCVFLIYYNFYFLRKSGIFIIIFLKIVKFFPYTCVYGFFFVILCPNL